MISFFRIFDKFIGTILILLLLPYTLLQRKNKNPAKILFIKLWALGDSVLTLPLLKELQKKYPEAQIDVYARKRNKAVYEGQSFVNKIILFEFPEFFKHLALFRAYDLVIDGEPYLNCSALLAMYFGKITIGFSHGLRSLLYFKKSKYDKNKHVVENYLKLINAENKNTTQLAGEDIQKFLKHFKLQNNKSRIIGICTGTAESASKTRLWPYFPELIKKLESYGKIVLVGTKQEKQKIQEIIDNSRAKAINAAGMFSTKELFSFIKMCNIFISIDTGPMHIAAAQGIPTIGLFGPNTPILWRPYNNKSIALYKNLECSPCINNTKPCFPDCLRKTEKYKCMHDITVDEVMNAIIRLMLGS
ncbi:glycosyltransferase family 9 protein [Candidatus Woesearchaeota archaeon]|nr:glycosyltransferase family 9 protein [Candidatus Woesearchaeota archaeon]